jgi:hypothetical protein
MFEYHAARSRPGPQAPDLYCKESPAHRKQLEHFARIFQKTVREHGLVERGRYSTAQAYRDRAANWTESSVDEPSEQGQSAQSKATPASPSTETRRVYPTHFSDTYMSLVLPTSGGEYGREGLLASLADISTWIDHCARARIPWEDDTPDQETRDRIWQDTKSCSDVLRLLLIDAATTDDESQRKKRLSTLLLLADHPGVGLDGFLDDGMNCCNLSTGVSALVDKTASVFIYLNLLLALVGVDLHGELLRPCDEVEDFGRDNARQGSGTRTPLLPRPTYMNTRSFARVLEEPLDEHGHAVEHVLFNPLFAPRPSGRLSRWRRSDAHSAPALWYPKNYDEDTRLERDVLADRESLAAALKSMWRVLVFCDMVFREAGRPINWEFVGLDAIARVFRGKAGVDRLLGQDWDEYEMDRKEAEGSFTFYENPRED